ncbi:MAG: GTPase HflX [Verrucomicrobiota bacterium]
MVERAMLVGVTFPGEDSEDAERLLDELEELVGTLGIGSVHRRLVPLRQPQAKFLVGSGKAEELIEEAREHRVDVIVFDNEISPGQQRNWEAEAKGLAIIDRQEIILDIFAERAQTREATLQVALARAEYNLPRLRRAWTHLSRQRGGGAVQRDSGETQLEVDQRMVRDRIAKLKRELGEVRQHRDTQRKRRMKVPVPSAAIVGYTNAGKSSLLNAMAGSEVLAEDKLFATLDPTSRRVLLPNGQQMVLTDTVGFVRRLPHRLVEAFKATLEEALVADFLIHVLDVTSPALDQHFQVTEEVVEELGAGGKPTLLAFNKIDLAEPETLALLRARFPDGHFISAATGAGLHELGRALEALLAPSLEAVELLIPHDRYDLLSRLHENGCVTDSKAEASGTWIRGTIPPRLHSVTSPYRIEV